MERLCSNKSKKTPKYIDGIDFNNDCIGFEMLSSPPSGKHLPGKYICIPGCYYKDLYIISSLGVVVMSLGSFAIGKEHLNNLEEPSRVYSFYTEEEMWNWMANH